MKRKLTFIILAMALIFTGLSSAKADEPDDKKVTTEQDSKQLNLSADPTFTQVIKGKIIDGGVEFMSIVLICLILGLTVAIEKVITLNLSSTNVNSLLKKLKKAIKSGDLDHARETAASEKGPVASVIAQALIRNDEGLSGMEKSIEAYGSAEVTKLEKGMTWIALFISLAPMFGFMGTVIGMIDAFGTIKKSADIKIGEVAGGIETALLTTAAGLVVAVILQVFYNYCQSKIEDITIQLEDGANGFVNLLVVNNKINKI